MARNVFGAMLSVLVAVSLSYGVPVRKGGMSGVGYFSATYKDEGGNDVGLTFAATDLPEGTEVKIKVAAKLPEEDSEALHWLEYAYIREKLTSSSEKLHLAGSVGFTKDGEDIPCGEDEKYRCQAYTYIVQNYDGNGNEQYIAPVVWHFMDLSINIVGEGTGSVAPSSVINATHEFDGKTYYATSRTYKFNVSPANGYYLSSYKLRKNTQKLEYYETSGVINTEYLSRHDTLDLVFKPYDNSITLNVDSRCKAIGLPSSAEYKDQVSFSIECDSDDYAIALFDWACSDPNDACLKSYSKKDGVYSFVKGRNGVTITASLGYKATILSDSTSFNRYYEEDENGNLILKTYQYIIPGREFPTYTFFPDGMQADSLVFDYELDSEVHHDTLHFWSSSCSGVSELNCRNRYFTMPAAPVKVRAYRHVVDYEITTDLGDTCEAVGLPSTAQYGDEVKFSLKCWDGYVASSVVVKKDRSSLTLQEESGVFTFTMPYEKVVIKTPSLKMKLMVEEPEFVSAEVYSNDEKTWSVSADNAVAKDDSVRFVVREIPGYQLISVGYSINGFTPSEDGQTYFSAVSFTGCEEGACTTKAFTMKNVPLTIRLFRTVVSYEVGTSDDEHCKIKGLYDRVGFEKTATFAVKCDEGYEANVSLTSENGTCPELEETEEGFSFVQPAFEVSVVVKSSKIVVEESSSSMKEESSSSSVAESSSSAEGSCSSVASSSSSAASSSSVKVDSSSSSIAEGSSSSEVSSSSSSVEGSSSSTESSSGVESSSSQDAVEVVQYRLSAFQVSVAGRNILISGVTANVAVFDMQGRVLKTAKMRGDLTLDMPGPGRYMVKVGGVTKVVNIR